MKSRLLRILAMLFAVALVAAACGSDATDDNATGDDGGTTEPADNGDDDPGEDDAGTTEPQEEDAAPAEPAGDPVTLEYWLWDGNQQPIYEQCAAEFTAANPNITINVTQFGWGDYWDGVSAGFASGTGPDVFTDHLARYPEFVSSGVLTPLNDFIERDGIDTGQYYPGLAELWVDGEGNRYGLPKDFDTIAVVTNSDLLADGGLAASDLGSLDWNPEDGGTFGDTIKHLTIDANGVRGDEDGFDGSNVETYGLGIQGGFGAFGQNTFSGLAASTGFEMLDVNPFGDSANYDDPRLAATIQWYADWIEAGFITPIEDVESLGGNTIFQASTAAMMIDGSWRIGTWIGDDTPFPVEFIPLPTGPTGERASMFNGLADSINASSDHQEEAWEWIKYLGSTACQDVMGAAAVVFPAIPSSADLAFAQRDVDGVDVSAFTVHLDEGTTFLFPITDSASEIEAVAGPAMQEILRGDVDAATRLADVDAEVDAILGS